MYIWMPDYKNFCVRRWRSLSGAMQSPTLRPQAPRALLAPLQGIPGTQVPYWPPCRALSWGSPTLEYEKLHLTQTKDCA